MRKIWLTCLCLAAALSGCGKPAADSAPVKPKDATLIDSGGALVTEAGFTKSGKTWPLTVPEAAVGCSPPNAAWVMSKGRRYGLNEWASQADGYLDLKRIQKIDQKAMDEAKKQAEEAELPEQAPKKKKRSRKDKEAEPIYVDAHDLTAAARARCG